MSEDNAIDIMVHKEEERLKRAFEKPFDPAAKAREDAERKKKIEERKHKEEEAAAAAKKVAEAKKIEDLKKHEASKTAPAAGSPQLYHSNVPVNDPILAARKPNFYAKNYNANKYEYEEGKVNDISDLEFDDDDVAKDFKDMKHNKPTGRAVVSTGEEVNDLDDFAFD